MVISELNFSRLESGILYALSAAVVGISSCVRMRSMRCMTVSDFDTLIDFAGGVWLGPKLKSVTDCFFGGAIFERRSSGGRSSIMP